MKEKKIVVHTAGSFDLFHIGHVNILKRSKELGDYLLVAVSSDELIKSYKGTEPIFSFEQRVKIVESISYVDEVVKQDSLHDIAVLKKYKPDITTIGDDWKTKHLDGLEWMRKHGKVVYLPYTEGISTTGVKKKILLNAYDIIYAQLKRELVTRDEVV
jgi:glycerol-3-phosphate cytidylyltransferase